MFTFVGCSDSIGESGQEIGGVWYESCPELIGIHSWLCTYIGYSMYYDLCCISCNNV